MLMDKSFKIILLALTVLGLLACKPENKTPEKDGTVHISGGINVPEGILEPEDWFAWGSDAAIGLFSAENVNAKYRLSSGAGQQSALFEGEKEGNITAHETVAAYFPYREGLSSSSLDVDVRGQKWKEGDRLPVELLLASCEADDPSNIHLSFAPALPIVVFRVKNAGEESISLQSVSLESEQAIFPERGKVDILSANPYVKAVGTQKQSLGVSMESAAALESGASVNIPLSLIPVDPGKFNVVLRGNGLEVSIEKSVSGGFKAGNVYFIDINLTEEGAEEDALTVLSFNIRFLDDNRPDYDYESGGQPWAVRRPAVKAFFYQNMPDVVGLCEVRRTQYSNLVEDFGEEWFIYCPGRISGGNMTKTSDESVGLMFRKTRFKELDHGCFWLSNSPNEIASKLTGQDYPMIVSWMHIEEKARPGKDMWFFSAHISWPISENLSLPDQEVEILLKQIEYLTDIDREDFKTSSTPVFVVGDLNNAPGASAINTLGGLFYDARLTCPETSSTYRKTYNAYGDDKGQKILDYIFYTAGSPKEYIVDNSTDYAEGVFYISDHYPVLFKLTY